MNGFFVAISGIYLGVLFVIIAASGIFPTNASRNKSRFSFMRFLLISSNIFNYYIMMVLAEILAAITWRGGFGESTTLS